MHHRSLFAVLATMLLATPTARAQSAAEAATRRSLLIQADHAAQSGDHVAALDFAERAARIASSPSIRYFLAREERLIGRLADALGNADLCVQNARRDPALHNRAAILSECQLIADELEPRVAHVMISAPVPTIAGLSVQVNGTALSDALLGTPYVVNPGRTTIDASAPGHSAFHQTLTPAAGATANITLELQADPSSSPPPPEPVASPSSAMHGPVVAGLAETTTVTRDVSSPVPYAVAGAGLVLLIASAVLWLGVYLPAYNTYLNICGSTHECLDVPQSHDTVSTAETGWTGGIITAATGGVLIIGGVLLGFVMRKPHVYRAVPLALRLDARPTAGGGILTIGGSL